MVVFIHVCCYRMNGMTSHKPQEKNAHSFFTKHQLFFTISKNNMCECSLIHFFVF